MADSKSYRLRVHGAQVVQVCNSGEKFKAGESQGQVAIIEKGTIIVNSNGLIEDVGPDVEMAAKYDGATFETDLDGSGKSIVPGFCDAHTHPVWSGDRVHEFAMKLAGATYMDIHKMGGGIGFTVQHTKNSSEDELKKLFAQRLDRMVKNGTTLVEAKSGYGLETETEMKMLRVIHQVTKDYASKIDITATYLAHSIPKGKTVAEALTDILDNQIPTLKKLKENGEISAEFVDVFCETGVFELEESKKILQAGIDAGLEINFHGDELHAIKSAEMGAELGALAISHLEKVSDEGIVAMAKRPTFAVLLPTTAYVLKLHAPPARKMIQNNVPVALGSDFNPNAHCMSMPFVMNLACVFMGMTMNESLVAATINSAAALNRATTHGSIEKGKFADFVVIDAPKWEHVIYELVDPPIWHVVKKGVIVN